MFEDRAVPQEIGFQLLILNPLNLENLRELFYKTKSQFGEQKARLDHKRILKLHDFGD